MEVRCERCRAQYAVDDARVSEAGAKVACAQCGHAFLLKKKTLAVTVPLKANDPDAPTPIGDLAPGAAQAQVQGGSERSEWRLRQPGGAVFPFRELSTLQRWIVERKASRDDQVSSTGEGDSWRRLGDIPELQSFFTLVDRARQRRDAGAALPAEVPAEVPVEPVRERSGMDDPAWASGPVQPARRITRNMPRSAAPRRRVIWVILIAVGLLATAAGTVYLRGKVEAEAAARAKAAEAASRAAVAAATPAVPAPVPAPTPAPAPAPAVVHAPDPAPAMPAPSEPVAQAQADLPAGKGVVAPASAEAPAPTPGGVAPAPDAPPRAEPPRAPVAAAPAAPATPASAPSAAPAAPARTPARDDAASALRSLLARARTERDRGRAETALDLYGQALALDGRNATALAGRGACYLDLSRYVQAEASFEGALESDPRNAEALFGLGETYRYMGRKEQAVTFYERFLSVRPTGDEAAAARRLVSQLKE